MTDARAKPSPRKTRGRSTGPRSTSGKQRSARNAFKHGLSIPATQTVLAAEVAELASKISGGNDEPLELAISIAEAQITLLRARRLRSELINRAVADPQFTSSKDSVRYIRFLGRLLRAEETGRFGAALQREALEWSQQRRESALERHARALKELACELRKLDRYEERALSRRKFAIRRFDNARNCLMSWF
jgi:hypothetical protein